MTSIIDSVKGILSIYTDDEPKGPLHIGEAMNLWTYHTMLTEINRFMEIALNTTTDDELIESLKTSHHDCSRHVEEIEKLLRDEGVELPTKPERKPHSNPQAVPPGVKMSDEEIANGIAVKQVTSINFCSLGLSQAIRGDIAAMWLRFFMDRVKYGAYFLGLTRKRGWIKVPPPYYPPGSLKH